MNSWIIRRLLCFAQKHRKNSEPKVRNLKKT
ncbi:MAG: hypothetical protein JJV89_05560 [Desulfosarcina sp.]|nr:hypothetical protein [Desulfobacterales bacterium]